MKIEICIEAVAGDALTGSVAAARAGGAARVELCAAMALQGITPNEEAIARARAALGDDAGLMVMVRPRGGDFRYDAGEIGMMLRQIDMAGRAGADGVVIGALKGDRPDDLAMARLVGAAREAGLAITFHRAFDAIGDRERALDELIGIGVDRVLTGGTRWGEPGSALDGVDMLRRLILRAEGRVEIVIAGGVSAGNAAAILRRLPAGCGPVSLHAWSSVLRDGVVSAAAVRELVSAAESARDEITR